MATPGTLPNISGIAHYNPNTSFLNYNEVKDRRVEEIGALRSTVYTELVGSGGNTYSGRFTWQNQVIGNTLYDYYTWLSSQGAQILTSYSMESFGNPSSGTPGDVYIRAHFKDYRMIPSN